MTQLEAVQKNYKKHKVRVENQISENLETLNYLITNDMPITNKFLEPFDNDCFNQKMLSGEKGFLLELGTLKYIAGIWIHIAKENSNLELAEKIKEIMSIV